MTIPDEALPDPDDPDAPDPDPEEPEPDPDEPEPDEPDPEPEEPEPDPDPDEPVPDPDEPDPPSLLEPLADAVFVLVPVFVPVPEALVELGPPDFDEVAVLLTLVLAVPPAPPALVSSPQADAAPATTRTNAVPNPWRSEVLFMSYPLRSSWYERRRRALR